MCTLSQERRRQKKQQHRHCWYSKGAAEGSRQTQKQDHFGVLSTTRLCCVRQCRAGERFTRSATDSLTLRAPLSGTFRQGREDVVNQCLQSGTVFATGLTSDFHISSPSLLYKSDHHHHHHVCQSHGLPMGRWKGCGEGGGGVGAIWVATVI